MSLDAPMLGFRYVCQKHRQLFADTLMREGCCDPEEMETVRRRLLVWLSLKFPTLVVEQFSKEACLGCAINEHQLDTGPIYDAVRQIVRELPRALPSANHEAPSVRHNPSTPDGRDETPGAAHNRRSINRIARGQNKIYVWQPDGLPTRVKTQ